MCGSWPPDSQEGQMPQQIEILPHLFSVVNKMTILDAKGSLGDRFELSLSRSEGQSAQPYEPDQQYKRPNRVRVRDKISHVS